MEFIYQQLFDSTKCAYPDAAGFGMVKNDRQPSGESRKFWYMDY